MFNNKLANIILSLVIGICLWAYVVYEVNPIQKASFKNIPVQIVNEDLLNERGLAISLSEEMGIDVTVEGKRKVVSGMDNEDFVVTADVSGCKEGNNVISVDVTVNKNASLVSDETITVNIPVEKLVTENRDVKVKFINQLDDGREADTQILTNQEVSVSGAKSLVSSVSYVAAIIDETKVKEKEQFMDVPLVPVARDETEIQNVKVSSKKAQVKVSIYDTKKVTLSVEIKGKVPEGYEYTGIEAPKSIQIRGDANQLEDIVEVKAEPIDISRMTATTKVALDINLPPGVEVSSKLETVFARVYVKAADSSSVSISEDKIDLKNVEDGLDTEILSGEVNITVLGKEKLSEKDFDLSADLKGLREGQHEIDLVIKYTGEGKIISAPEKITVKISKKQ